MNRLKIAGQLVKIAKELVGGREKTAGRLASNIESKLKEASAGARDFVIASGQLAELLYEIHNLAIKAGDKKLAAKAKSASSLVITATAPEWKSGHPPVERVVEDVLANLKIYPDSVGSFGGRL